MWVLRNNETTVSVEKHWWWWLFYQGCNNNSNARQTGLSLSHSYSYLNPVKSWKQYCGTERRPTAANNLTANSPDFWKREISPLVFPVNIQIKMISFVMSFSLRPDFAMFKLFWKSAWFIQTTYWINTQILTILRSRLGVSLIVVIISDLDPQFQIHYFAGILAIIIELIWT